MGIFSRLFQRGQDGERTANEGDKPASEEGAPSEAVASTENVSSSPPVLAAAVAGGAGSLTAPFWGWPQRHSEPAREPGSMTSDSPSPAHEDPPVAATSGGDDAGAKKALPSLPKPPQQPAAASSSAPVAASANAPPVASSSAAAVAAPAPPAASAATVEAPRRAATSAGKTKRDDSTMVMSPPPAVPAGAMRPIPAPPPAAVMPPPEVKSSAAETVVVAQDTIAEAPDTAHAAAKTQAAPVAAATALAAEHFAAAATAATDAAWSVEPSAAEGAPSNPFSLDAAADLAFPVEAIEGDEISASFNRLFLDGDVGLAAPVAAEVAPRPAAGISTAEDLAAVRDVFNDIAVVHVSQVRDVMLELRFGDADPAWLESTKPALRSLRAMAEQMELVELCGALDTFCVAVDGAVANRARISDDDKADLLARYQALSDLIPQAFELDAERDRREPIIVEALLYQIDGVEKPIIDRLFAVGLNRLDALLRVNHDDLVAMAGLRPEVAAAIVDQFRTYRATADAAVSTRDPAAERRSLGDLVIMLSILQDDFLRASDDWTADARARKRTLRKEREQTFQRIRVSLVRLGDRDQLAKLERLPFNERIAALERYVANQPSGRA